MTTQQKQAKYTPQGIKALRLRLGLTQMAFAKRLGVAFATINRWEMGRYKPNRWLLKEIAALDKRSKKVCPRKHGVSSHGL